MNLVPSRYRSVAVTTVPVPLQEQALRDYFSGALAYRRTRYIVARGGTETAVIEVHKHSTEPLFSEMTAITLVAGPSETTFVHAPETDTAVPSQLARAAAMWAPTARCVVVQGRYEHINFILEPAPLRIRVLELSPPQPPKLYDQAQRILELADQLPPVELIPEVVELADLARERPSQHYLLPCRAGDVPIEGAAVSFLDEIPPQADWTQIGCARSRAIHERFYGHDADRVDMCPRTLLARESPPAPVVTLTKCCLLETHIEREGETVLVPWGASFDEIRDGLTAAVEIASIQQVGTTP